MSVQSMYEEKQNKLFWIGRDLEKPASSHPLQSGNEPVLLEISEVMLCCPLEILPPHLTK